MAKVEYRELKGFRNHKDVKYKASFVSPKTRTTDEVARSIEACTSLTVSDVKSAIEAIGQYLATELANGNAVNLKGIGTLTPQLAIGETEFINPKDGTAAYTRFRGVHIDRVHFKVQNSVLKEINTIFRPEVDSLERIVPPSTGRYDVETRKQLVVDYLEKKQLMSVKEYIMLTGLSSTMARQDLAEWSEGENAFLENRGSSAKHIYVLKK